MTGGSSDDRLSDMKVGVVGMGGMGRHHARVVRGLEFSPDGLLLGSASEDGKLLLWGVTD